ncbi:MAG TPA: iron-siderophore ABC transporter substrate-binding protein [Trueperaceae bacterium]|nr:iron-siderophore ABC transporter substrate-binding protein [Trueperaceae bacterium]
MRNLRGLLALLITSVFAVAGAQSADAYPVTIDHALGSTVLSEKPVRVATVNWANHEVPLALGVMPVGFAAANFGDDDGDGLLPWVAERMEELGAAVPVLFDEGDGIDFEAVAATRPDVILAAYSGLSQEDYDTLSLIAPTIAYPEAAWATDWRDMIRFNSAGMGMAAEGAALIESLDAEIRATAALYPQLADREVMFITHLDTTDLSTVRFYSANDTRVKFFADLGLKMPQSVIDASAGGAYSGQVSAEQIDVFDDVELIVTYGGQELIDALSADPLTSKMPAVASGAIVTLANDPLGTAANPTPLSISWVLADYVKLLADAVDKVD